MAPAETTPEAAKKTQKAKYLTRKQANSLIIDSGIAIQAALEHLEQARALAAKAGLSVDSNILPTNTIDPNAPLTVKDTGGHSNTDHVVIRTGNQRQDRLSELKRNLWRRHRAIKPENRGEDRWDKPRIPGERRRRIVREKDSPEAPPDPPHTGYVVFVGQMTTKIRYDRPNVPHDQARVVQEISKIWRIGMNEDDRIYYTHFAQDARREYEKQVVEYRATGKYTPSSEFVKLPDVNVWVRQSRQNGLEREISDYESCQFPKRPASMDKAYEKREVRSKLKRKLKLKGLWSDDGTYLKNGLDFETLLEEERQSKAMNEEGEGEEEEGKEMTATIAQEEETEVQSEGSIL